MNKNEINKSNENKINKNEIKRKMLIYTTKTKRKKRK